MSASRRLEALRQAAHAEGIPLDCIDRLALRPARAARLLDVSSSLIDQEIAEGHLVVTWIRGARRISILDLVDYLEARRSRGRRALRAGEASPAETLVRSFRRA